MIRKRPLPKVAAETAPTKQRTVNVHDVDFQFPGQEDDRFMVSYAHGRTATICKRNLWFVAKGKRTTTENVPVVVLQPSYSAD